MHRQARPLHSTIIGLLSPLLLLVACGNPMPPIDAAAAPADAASAALAASKGRIIRVPQDQPTIAAGMAAARAGDTVKLDPGTYKETLVLKTGVRVVGGPSTIDATGLDNGILGDASVTSGASVEQLTVQNSTYQGVYIGGSKGVRLSNCAIRASGIQSQSAGLRSDDAQLSIENCEVSGSGGAGIRVVTSDVSLKGSRVVGNAGAGLRADGSKAAIVNNVIEKNAGAGARITHGSTATVLKNQLNGNNLGIRIDAGDDPADYHSSSGRVESNVMTDNAAYGVFVDQGSSANLEQNQITGSPDTGILVSGGYDPANQKRCSVHLEKNIITGNGIGLQIFDSDATSEGDRFEHNGIGILAAFGASVAASDGSVLGSAQQGVFARDALEYFFCGNDDCTVTQIVVATVHVSLDHMRVEGSGAGGVTAWGSEVKVSASSLRGNVDGVFAFSGSDYELGDGVIHHLETPGVVTVEGSQLEVNTSNGAFEDGTSALRLQGNSIQGNLVGVQIYNGGSAQIEENTIVANSYFGVNVSNRSNAIIKENLVANNQGDGISIMHGAGADVLKNKINGNRGSGIDVLSSWDPTQQVQSSGRLEENVVTGNANGLVVMNSRATSKGDRYDQNTSYGVNAAQGAELTVREGSVTGNQYGGVWARDMNFFCVNADCSLQQVAVASVRLSLDRMQISNNRFNGCAATGAQVDIRASNFTGNGGSGAIIASSGWDYDLGDGVPRHLEMPGSMKVRNSSFAGNTPWSVVVQGGIAANLGGLDPGRNSFLGGSPVAVLNQTSPVVTIPAEGNWWGTADPAAIAAMVSAPVDFVPFLTSPPR